MAGEDFAGGSQNIDLDPTGRADVPDFETIEV